MMLTQLKPGKIARIVTVDGEHKLRQRLSSRGISEGSFVRVISCYGPITCEVVNRKTFTIGYGIAQRIRVIRVPTV